MPAGDCCWPGSHGDTGLKLGIGSGSGVRVWRGFASDGGWEAVVGVRGGDGICCFLGLREFGMEGVQRWLALFTDDSTISIPPLPCLYVCCDYVLVEDGNGFEQKLQIERDARACVENL